LLSAGPDVPYTALGQDGYVGFQPLFTEWQQHQPTNVEIGGRTVGSYDVFESDYATPWSDESVYMLSSGDHRGRTTGDRWRAPTMGETGGMIARVGDQKISVEQGYHNLS
jgi:hypothetical protein